jgi:hypothetical protein
MTELEFYEEPYEQISVTCKDPKELVNSLISKYENLKQEMKREEEFFPGDTNFVGNCFYDLQESLDSLLYFLKMIHHGTL